MCDKRSRATGSGCANALSAISCLSGHAIIDPMKNPKRPRDTNQLAKSIVDLSTGQAEEKDPDKGKDPAAVALGRKGGRVGGKARAEKLSASERKAIAKKAAFARWGKSQDD